jgi:YVTN family beta-propeller protein
MKSRFQALWLVLSTGALLLLAVGCNDTLRQFITPVPPPTGDPGALAHAITISTNPVPASTGTDMHIDVSGDSSVGTVRLGINPVFLGKSGNRVFAINSGDGGSTPPTVSVYTALLPQSSSVTTVTLPSAPDPDAAVNPVAGGTSNSGNIYIANKGSNNISVIAASVLAVTATIKLPAGDSGPVMIAGNTANNQIFVVNQTSNNVSVIDASLRTVIALIPVGASPNFAFYEPKLQRLYVSNTGAGTVSVIRADNITAANPPAKLKDVLVSGTPTSVTALSNGSRAYAALGNCPAGVNHTTIIAQLGSCSGNLVSVIDTTSLLETATIAVGTGPISIDASSDSSRVFVVNSHDTVTNASGPHTAGTISDIRTSTNTETVRKLAPQQDPNCAVSSTVFCPTQTPFRVITFP